MKVCIYARVSTEDQTTENQVRELEEWTKRRGWEIVTIYRENETAWKAGHQKNGPASRLMPGCGNLMLW